MQYITVSNNQTCIDIAMQYAGTAEAAWDICVKNNLPITAALEAGSQLPKPAIINNQVVIVFSVEKAVPCSNTAIIPEEGIGYWFLEDDFIVQ